VPARPGSAGQSDRPNAWDDGEGRWNLYFAVVLAGTLVVVQAAGGASEPRRLIAIGALLAMVPWYLAVGRPAMYSRDDGRHPAWTGLAYLLGLVPLLAAAEYCAGIDTFILLALCPQAFMAVSSYRVSIGAVVALNGIEVAVALVRGYTAGEILSTAGIAVLGITFSVAFGTWIVSIINQSAERAELIAQLEQTRADLAEANREAGVLAERDRLASEIHDTIAQGFTSIVMLVQAGPPPPRADRPDRQGEPQRGQGAGRRAGPGRLDLGDAGGRARAAHRPGGSRAGHGRKVLRGRSADGARHQQGGRAAPGVPGGPR
jgi:signal transduction histidine kinase